MKNNINKNRQNTWTHWTKDVKMANKYMKKELDAISHQQNIIQNHNEMHFPYTGMPYVTKIQRLEF